jgi:hypothetical protein
MVVIAGMRLLNHEVKHGICTLKTVREATYAYLGKYGIIT